ncbi:MAG TPA: hypothetical protein VKH44_14960, partial [Pirellulaceae bacterium]|nr:hypothetical protein [Pirellulaceae bacterium]
LLVMLAIAAFLGWGTMAYRHRRFEPTPFYSNNETWQPDVRAIYEELGEPGFDEAAGSVTYSGGASAVRRSFYFRIPLSPSNRQPFLDAFENRVREKMKAEGCRIEGAAGGAGSSGVRIVSYQWGSVRGIFEICVMDAGGEGKVGVIVTMLEQEGAKWQQVGVRPNLEK